MSRITDNFERILDSQERTVGSRLTATVGGVTAKDALISEVPSDLSPEGGGWSEQGTLELQMRKSDFSTPPVQGQSVTARGKTLAVHSFREPNPGIYVITAFDPTAEVN